MTDLIHTLTKPFRPHVRGAKDAALAAGDSREPWQGARRSGTRRLGLLALLTAGACVLAAAPAAMATTPAPGWTLDSLAQPTAFSADDNPHCSDAADQGLWLRCDRYVLTAANAGSEPTDGSDVTLTDTLPAGLTVQKVSFFWSGLPQEFGGPQLDLGFLCATAGQQASCDLPTASFGLPPVAPRDTLKMIVYVTVDAGASGALTNAATVSGGGAPGVSTSEQNEISSAPAAFGVAHFSSYIAGLDGRPDTRAGAHPYELTTRVDLANALRKPPSTAPVQPTSVEDVKDVIVDLPLGFLGSALAAPTCTQAQLFSGVGNELAGTVGGCPADTIVGHIKTEPVFGGRGPDGPIYNMVPERGVAAEFGYVDLLQGMHALYARVAPTPAGYVLRTTSPDVPQIELTDIVVTFFGNPAAQDGTGNQGVPMFTNPTDCSAGPLTTAVHMDSWQHPGRKLPDGSPDLSDQHWASATSESPPVQGCNRLKFDPQLTLTPETTAAASPSGLDVEIKVPQSTDPDTLATPPLRKAVVTLPPGYAVNPSSADGLGACSPAQIALDSAAPPTCPDSSKIGTVELQTPLLPGTLTGSIYLATQNDNPFHSLLAGYIVVDDSTTGVVIKIPGNLTPDPETGQITGVFDDNPQFPFSDLKLHFKGGSRGVLVTAPSCGTFSGSTELTPWSAPDSGPPASFSPSLAVTTGPNGAPCPAPQFKPTLHAGLTNPVAGSSSTFVLRVQRDDIDNEFKTISTTMPPGLLAKVAGVPLCGDAQATAGNCPAESQIGRVEVGAGAGSNPFYITNGKVFLTEGYKGGPFGLSISVPAVAGPFDLGTVNVRAALQIDPLTAQVTVAADPMPRILQGIPLQVRDVRVIVDRPDFMRAPTNCDEMSVGATIGSYSDDSASVANRFQVGECSRLSFAPKISMGFTNRSQVHKRKKPGLDFKLSQKSGEANIKSVTVKLPRSVVLDVNGASGALCEVAQAENGTCPASSIVGHATALTPLLDQPLTGNVYFVRGDNALPNIMVALRGQININLRSKSRVDKMGRLISTFGTVPDAPISQFHLSLGSAGHGVLSVAPDSDLCTGHNSKGRVSIGIVGQNGKRKALAFKIKTPCKKARKHRR